MLESLFNKVADLRSATLLKKRLWHRCFPVNFVKFLKTPFFTENLRTTASSHYFVIFSHEQPYMDALKETSQEYICGYVHTN